MILSDLNGTGKKVNNKKVLLADGILFLLLAGVYSVLTYKLFYMQCLNPDTLYSDMPTYIAKSLGQDSGYSTPYPILFWVSTVCVHLTTPEVGMSVATLLFNVAALLVTKYYITKLFEKGESTKKYAPLLSTAAVFMIFMVSMIYFPYSIQKYFNAMMFRYIGAYSGNPFHNATYLAVRPFAVATFFVFAKILKEYEEKTDIRDHIVFTILLLLATLTKPSFTFILVPAAGLVMLYRWGKTGFRNWKQTFNLGYCFIPTFITLIIQFMGRFGQSDAETTSEMTFLLGGAWKIHTTNIPLGIVLGMAFPLLFLVLNLKKLKDNQMYRFSWQMWLVGTVTHLILCEKGRSYGHANFAWGYMHGMFFVFMTSIILLIESTCQKNKKWYVLMIEWLVLMAHVVCGIYYFYHLLCGGYALTF